MLLLLQFFLCFSLCVASDQSKMLAKTQLLGALSLSGKAAAGDPRGSIGINNPYAKKEIEDSKDQIEWNKFIKVHEFPKEEYAKIDFSEYGPYEKVNGYIFKHFTPGRFFNGDRMRELFLRDPERFGLLDVPKQYIILAGKNIFKNRYRTSVMCEEIIEGEDGVDLNERPYTKAIQQLLDFVQTYHYHDYQYCGRSKNWIKAENGKIYCVDLENQSFEHAILEGGERHYKGIPSMEELDNPTIDIYRVRSFLEKNGQSDDNNSWKKILNL